MKKIKKSVVISIILLLVLSSCSSKETTKDKPDFSTSFRNVVASFVNQLDEFYLGKEEIDQNFLSNWNDFYNPIDKVIILDGKEYNIENMVDKDFSVLMSLSQMVGNFDEYEDTYSYSEAREKVVEKLAIKEESTLKHSQREITDMENKH